MQITINHLFTIIICRFFIYWCKWWNRAANTAD